VFEKRMLRRIFVPKREEEAGSWRRQHNEELHNLYATPNIIRVIKSRTRWVKHVARIRGLRKVDNILVENPERKGSLGRPSRRWETSIRMDLREIG
jgi:hypothetical protein